MQQESPVAASILPARATAASLGSSWDLGASPDRVIPDHLSEWVTGSGVAPELAAANLQSLAGRDVLEALAGDRIEQLGGWATQYATGKVARILRPLEPIAEGGGWWVSGLDPLAIETTDRSHLPFTRPMAWGQFKPNRPRQSWKDGQPQWNKDGSPKLQKYEAPVGQPTRSAWLRVPAVVAQRVADRYSLPLPSAVAADVNGNAGAFWRWVAAEPRLPMVITEGAKKAGALLSVGVPAVALPGVDNGAKRTGEKDPTTNRRTGPVEFLPDLAAVPWAGRSALVLFDRSDKPNPNEPRAARRLGYHLRRAGAQVLVGICPGPAKGADDHLVAGGSWEELAAALQPLTAAPATPHLRKADQLAPAGYLSDGVDLAELRGRRLVAIAAPMGAGKTRLARELVAEHLADGVPILAPTHRTSLGEASAAAVGIPWAAAPGDDQRLQGLGLCWDSLRPSSGLRINPAEWTGSGLMLDEVAQGIEHLLFGTGTAVAEHRLETMATTGTLARSCPFALAMDAQLPEAVLQLFETLTGERFHLLGSEHRPMAGRPVVIPQGLTARTAAEQGRAHILRLAKAGKTAMVITTAQQAHVKGSAQNIAKLVRRHQKGADPFVVDSTTPEAAERLAADPNGTVAAHGWLIASPAITSGLSIDKQAVVDEVVVIAAGGRLTCEHIAQAAARVRDPRVPVTIYAPAIAPQLRIGSGATTAAELLQHLATCEARLLAALVGAAEWEPAASNESPWLRCWLEMAAHRNRQSHAYSATIAALLEAEGWAITTSAEPAAPELIAEASADLAEITEAATAAEDAALITAEPITAAEAADLAERRRLTPEERAQLQRHRIAARWGLGATAPTPELLAADRERLSQRLRFAWILQDARFRQLAAVHDQRRAQQLTADGQAWAPDLTRELLRHKIDAADALGLPDWLRRREWFSADDQQLQQLQLIATTHAATITAALGVAPGKRASGTLRGLLRLCGFRLDSRRARCGNGCRGWQYRITPEALPAGVDHAGLITAWADQLTPEGV